MSPWKKALLLQIWFFIGFPMLGALLYAVLGFFGILIQLALLVLWCWELFAYFHYRHCRQEEFLQVLQTAAVTQAPIESVFRAYLRDRPRDRIYRGILLSFVFPGYFWIHHQRSFDERITRLADMLDSGMPLDLALRRAPGVVTNDIALAVSVGNYSGELSNAFQRLPDRRLGPQWLELAPRLLYPILTLTAMVNVMSFLLIFILPKFEKMMLDFKIKPIPESTALLITTSRWFFRYAELTPGMWVLLVVFLNVLVFSSYAKWHFPLVNWVYRLSARGQFLRALGLMLETGRPLPEVLDHVLETRLLPNVIAVRAARLASDVENGQPLADSLAKHGLAPASMVGLIASAQKSNNLSWALQELGDSLMSRSAKVFHRLTMISFPLLLLVIAGLVGFVAYAMFSPLVAMMDKMHG